MQGGYHTAVLLRCIFGNSFWNMKNTIPASVGIKLPDFIGLIVYWVLTFPLLNIPIPKFRKWTVTEAAMMPFALFGTSKSLPGTHFLLTVYFIRLVRLLHSDR